MIDLKPCPFCGTEVTASDFFEERIFIMNNAFMMGIKCGKCGGGIIDANKDHCPNDVFRAWNKRLEKE